MCTSPILRERKSKVLLHDQRIPFIEGVTYPGYRFNVENSSLKHGISTIKDLGHEIHQWTAIFGFLSTSTIKFSFQALWTLFWGWNLGKIRLSSTISKHCKTHDKAYRMSLRVALRSLTGLHKSFLNSVLCGNSGFHPLLQWCGLTVARIFFDLVEIDNRSRHHYSLSRGLPSWRLLSFEGFQQARQFDGSFLEDLLNSTCTRAAVESKSQDIEKPKCNLSSSTPTEYIGLKQVLDWV